ncbi:MAG: tRNA epoxyqueuosine(34) reductase QueG, partial [Verrucomicrobia bacterium]|nr:tRNA epoxyqueuosine(34) reductase QueG [Verrucomicrobiota bacterium]
MFGMHESGDMDRQATAQLKEDIRRWGRELGFDAIGFAGTDLGAAEAGLAAWLAAGCQGEMD